MYDIRQGTQAAFFLASSLTAAVRALSSHFCAKHKARQCLESSLVWLVFDTCSWRTTS